MKYKSMNVCENSLLLNQLPLVKSFRKIHMTGCSKGSATETMMVHVFKKPFKKNLESLNYCVFSVLVQYFQVLSMLQP